MTPRQLGKYQLQQSLGKGTTGEVWKAYDLQFRQEVAVKLIHTDLQADPHFFTHFMEEGQSLVELKHENIVTVREVNVARAQQGNQTSAYLVMDYIEGQTLEHYLQLTAHRGIFPSIDQIVYLFTSLGVAVDYAHQRGFVHGNITPGNILLKSGETVHFVAGEPILTDVGLTRLLGGGGIVGAPQYMSPEQARGEAPNNRSDIYALGVLLYECCTGVQPFRNGSSVAVMQQHINALPTPPALINPNIPPELSEVILRAMAKDTATRYAMASLLATALADACSIQSNRYISLQTPSLESRENRQNYAAQSSLLGVPQPPEVAHPQSPVPQRSTSQLRPINLSSGLRAESRPLEQPQSVPATPLPASLAAPRVREQENESEKQSFPLVSAVAPVPVQRYEQTTAHYPLQSVLAEIASPTPSKALQTVQVESHIPPPKKRQTSFYLLVAIVLVIFLVIGGTLVGLATFLKGQGAGSASGQIFFQDDALGHNDLLRLEMKNMPAPASGKSYVVWLQDTNQKVRRLGTLSLSGKDGSLLYAGDSQHTNLLPIVQDIFITQENSGAQLAEPSQPKVFQTVFNAKTFPAIKRLLTQDSRFPGSASVVSGMFETIKSMNDKAGSIVDSISNTGDLNLARRQVTRIIEILDGTSYARSSGDLPAQYPSQLPTNIGLLSTPQQVGYLDILSEQLDQIANSAGNDQGVMQHIQNVRYAINDLKDWLQKARVSSVQLLKAADLKNATSMSIALQLKQAAADAYTGHTIPPNASPLPIAGSAGAAQAYTECQYLATLELQKAQN